MGVRAIATSLATILLVALFLAGCGGPDVTFVSEAASYSLEQVEALHLSATPPDSIRDEPVSTASERRRDALVELRSRGGEAAELAEFITRSLTDTGRSVPYYGEAAVVEDTSAWILLEAWGPEGGIMDSTRLWVFDRGSGAVLYSSSNR